MAHAPEGVTIRVAALTDIPAIVAVQARSWRAAYRGIVDDSFLEAIPMDKWVESWRAIFFTPDAQCFVAEENRRVIGFVSVGRPEEVEQVDPLVAELHTIYMDAGHYGLGVGGHLLETALEHLRTIEFRECILWVLEDNQRARAFYEKGGWEPDGSRASDCWGATSVPRVRYRRSLSMAT